MKKPLIIASLLFYFNVSAQIVNIPDANFKYLLLSGTVTSDIDGFPITLDLNNDNQIQETEAQTVYGIHLWQNAQYTVSDLTGINAFTNLQFLNVDHHNITVLDLSGNTHLRMIQSINNPVSTLDVSTNIQLDDLQCPNNALSQIDVSNNIYLRNLELNNNELSTIDVSSNVILERLFVSDNQLSNLDVSQNPTLGGLTFQNNLLSEIDLSNNPQLAVLYCQNNLLSTVDLSNNPEMDFFDCSYNPLESFNVKNGSSLAIFGFAGIPSLQSICADAFEIDTVQTKISEYGYSNVSVNTSCNSLGTADMTLSNVAIYPNPATTQIIMNNLPSNSKLSIYNIDGKLVFESAALQEIVTVNLENFVNGIYFLNVNHDGLNRTEEFVVTGN